MDKEKFLALAKTTYATLCSALDENGWHYKKDEEKLTVQCGAQGEDLPIELVIEVDADRQLVVLLSHLPVKVPEDKLMDVTVAISTVNNVLVHGCFDYNVRTGQIIYRMANSFMDSLLGSEMFNYMIYAACHVIDEYNDKLIMLSKGMISIEKFLETETKE